MAKMRLPFFFIADGTCVNMYLHMYAEIIKSATDVKRPVYIFHFMLLHYAPDAIIYAHAPFTPMPMMQRVYLCERRHMLRCAACYLRFFIFQTHFSRHFLFFFLLTEGTI